MLNMSNNVKFWRVLIKSFVIFLIFETTLTIINPPLGTINIYSVLKLKRFRFPTSTHAPADAALDVGNLDAMFASHIVSQPKANDEFRVLLLGDSAMWGFLLQPEQTISGQINALNLTCGNKKVQVYNLSYPRSSATKDLMILDKAMKYQPDLIIWPVTLYTLMPKTRIDHWLIGQNPDELYSLDARFHFLPKDYPPESLSDKIFDPQKSLFRVLRYQLYSFIQLATGIDQIQTTYDNVPTELPSDLNFEGMNPPTVRPRQISIDEVQDFYALAKNVPVILINEPIQIVKNAQNSNIYYNYYYPRWVYDQYRQILGAAATQNNWNYLDWWDKFTSDYYTNTPLHLNPVGERQFAEMLAPSIQKACP